MKISLSKLSVRPQRLVLLRRRGSSGYFPDGILITGMILTGGDQREIPNMIPTTKMDFSSTMTSPGRCPTTATLQ